jgi:NAD(P)-dependent dehydrogenase (short-subunit alcohol dehydrogenase family)
MNDRAHLASHHAVITGANTGIGYVTALELARAGARITIAGRSRDKSVAAMERIIRETGNPRVDYVPLDLGDLDDVRRCAEDLASGAPIDLLINNAGLAGTRGVTRQGFELAFGTNHLGHYLLTRLLFDQLRHGARVLNVASTLHRKTKVVDWTRVVGETRSYTGLPEYSVSKLANVLFTAELARRYAPERVFACSLHPGRVATEVYRRVPRPLLAITKLWKPMLTPEQGAATTLHCATAPLHADHGAYFADCKPAPASPLAADRELARELWDRSAAWVGLPA